MTLTGRIDNADIPDPSTSDGLPSVITLRCATCDWSITAKWASVAYPHAQAHVDDTGHEIAYRGVVQECFRPSSLKE